MRSAKNSRQKIWWVKNLVTFCRLFFTDKVTQLLNKKFRCMPIACFQCFHFFILPLYNY